VVSSLLGLALLQLTSFIGQHTWAWTSVQQTPIATEASSKLIF
jgi:hypothetical protein